MVYETLAGKLLANRKKQTHRQNKRAQKYKQTMEKIYTTNNKLWI
jgi:hypothetical protein